MSKLYFKYGALNSSKTANLLMTAHNYRETGRKVLLLQSSKNTRDKVNKITSRIGIESECLVFHEEENLKELIEQYINKLDVVLIDEIQFATPTQIKQLVNLLDTYKDLVVITYGLKSTYTAELFPSIATLLVYADHIEEVKQVCAYCSKKAHMNLKIRNNKPVYEGEIISIGDVKDCEEYYVPVCREHYLHPIIKNK